VTHGAGRDGRASDPVRDGLVELVALETGIVESLGAWDAVVGDGEAAEAIAAMREAAASRRDALERRIGLIGAGNLGAIEPRVVAAPPASPSAALRRAASMVLDAAYTYEAVYLAARLGYDYDTCDLLEAHLADCIAGNAATWRAFPHAVAHELADVGAICTCRCPMCSIGLCGCIRATLAVAERGWTGHEPEPSRGLLLQSPPRPGSQLADAGLRQGDRVLSVDGDEVGDNAEVQAALRRREVGEEARLGVERPTGERIEITVRRVA
jgi:PDZ domain